MNINKTEIVEKQYENAEQLNIRIYIHQKYSTNKQGFSNWILEQYDTDAGDNILELGCGNGYMWKNHPLPKKTQLILTDFSVGMLDEAKKNNVNKNIIFNQVDIQDIPYQNESFDMVIANMMKMELQNMSNL